ncbi:calcium-binding protein [Oleomonas cavernae]|uniref:Calcium-binding protein n=1 Tax=Oleomonas cavernae TaxID=2320859 RepID=A0A418WC15_9PROT|nr:calcium-binding protein [Oleomonas cavernae]RJF87571.1 calcium-binding protein [Oleomonas cavernae]
MRNWNTPGVAIDREAFSSTVDAAGQIHFYFAATDAEKTTVDGLKIDRLGGVAGAIETVLQVEVPDPSLPPRPPTPGYYQDFPDLVTPPAFDRALTGGDGSRFLFSSNLIEHYEYFGEPYDDTGYYEKTYYQDYYTAYVLGDSTTYDDFEFVVRGELIDVYYNEYAEFYDEEADEYYYEGIEDSYALETSIEGVTVGAFDSAGFLAAYRSQTYVPQLSGLYARKIDPDVASQPAVLLDGTPVGDAAVIERAGDLLGVVWVNSVGTESFVLSMGAFRADGTLQRSFNTTIPLASLDGQPVLSGLTVLGAATVEGGDIFAVVEIGGVPYLGQFTAALQPAGDFAKIAGGRWTGSTREHVETLSIVALPDGGFVMALSLEQDDTPGGADHRIVLQQYDGDGAIVGSSFKIAAADGGWVQLGDLGDGRVVLSWTHDGQTLTQTLDTRTTALVDAGTPDVDTTIGTALGDTLSGDAGNDRLVGGAGNDRLLGEAGNDLLIGGAGADRMDGGAGRDVARFETAVTVDLLDGSLNTGEAKGDLFTSIESLRGSYQDDRLSGTNGADILDGQGGDDWLLGRDGDDILIGGSGLDKLFGGAGADQFRFEGKGEGHDTIDDFTRGTDLIVLRQDGFDITALNLVVANAPVASTGAATFLFKKSTGLLSFDADGNGAGQAIEVATLTGINNLTSADFLLIA